MPIDWKSQESYQRLLAALVAASDNSIDYKKVAYYFGQGATYDAIEGRFRIAKRMAGELKQEAEDEGRQMPTTRPKSTQSTPRKPKAKPNGEHSVASGRVQKSPSKNQKSPSKKANPKAKVKQEPDTPTSLDSDEGGAQTQGPQLFPQSNPFMYSDSEPFFHSFSHTDQV